MTEREAQALRDEFAGLSKEIRAAYRQGYADGVNDEREAVVAWLRAPSSSPYVHVVADDIDYGEHRAKGKP
jgi:hypothetical protein